MATNPIKSIVATAIATTAVFAILLTATRADESVLVKKTDATSDQPVTGPVLPPPQNPSEQSAAAQSKTVELPPPSRYVPDQEVLPTPPQRALIPPQTNLPTSPANKTNQSFMRPAEPRLPARGKLVNEEPMPMPSDGTPLTGPMLPPPGDEIAPPTSPLPPGIQVKPTPRIDYDTHHDARKMLRSGAIHVVVLTQDPAEGCYYQIPLTVPACCAGEPSVSGSKGLLGRGIVAYEWPCGFKAKIKFRHLLGDVKVDYEAD